MCRARNRKTAADGLSGNRSSPRFQQQTRAAPGTKAEVIGTTSSTAPQTRNAENVTNDHEQNQLKKLPVRRFRERPMGKKRFHRWELPQKKRCMPPEIRRKSPT